MRVRQGCRRCPILVNHRNNDLFLAKGTLHTWTGVNNVAELSAVLSSSTFFATHFDRSIGLWAQTKDPNRMTHFGFLPSTIRIKNPCFLTPTLYWLSERTLIAFSKLQCYLKYSSKKTHITLKGRLFSSFIIYTPLDLLYLFSWRVYQTGSHLLNKFHIWPRWS